MSFVVGREMRNDGAFIWKRVLSDRYWLVKCVHEQNTASSTEELHQTYKRRGCGFIVGKATIQIQPEYD